MFYWDSESSHMSVEDAARMLRVSRWTIYRNLHDVPHVRIGPYIRIDVRWLFGKPPVVRVARKDWEPEVFQPMLPIDVKPARLWRNTKKPVYLNHFGYPIKEKRNG